MAVRTINSCIINTNRFLLCVIQQSTGGDIQLPLGIDQVQPDVMEK